MSVATVGLVLAACFGVGTQTPARMPIPVAQPAPTVRAEPTSNPKGAELYATNCQVCHGDLRGLGGSGAPPQNQYGHTWHHPDVQLKDWVINGKRFGFSQMPAFKNILTDPEVDDVLSYIKASWTEDQRETQADVSVRYQEALDKQKEGR